MIRLQYTRGNGIEVVQQPEFTLEKCETVVLICSWVFVVGESSPLSVLKICSAFFTQKLTVVVLVLSHLDYCPVIWSRAAKKDIEKLQLAQNRAARLALNYTSVFPG
jgi:hypothetical protein